MNCVGVSNSACGGRTSVVIRSLSLKKASFSFRGGESVSMLLRLDHSKVSRVSGDSIFYEQELAQRRWQARRQFLPREYLALGAESCGSYALHDPIPLFQ